MPSVDRAKVVASGLETEEKNTVVTLQQQAEDFALQDFVCSRNLCKQSNTAASNCFVATTCILPLHLCNVKSVIWNNIAVQFKEKYYCFKTHK